ADVRRRRCAFTVDFRCSWSGSRRLSNHIRAPRNVFTRAVKGSRTGWLSAIQGRAQLAHAPTRQAEMLKRHRERNSAAPIHARRFARAPHVRATTGVDETVLLDVERGRYYALNE